MRRPSSPGAVARGENLGDGAHLRLVVRRAELPHLPPGRPDLGEDDVGIGQARPVSNGQIRAWPAQRGSSRNARTTGMPVSAWLPTEPV